MNSKLFTALTISEEAILSGGAIKATSTKVITTTTNITRSNSNIQGASGGVASGGSIGNNNTPYLSSAPGVYISN